MEIQRIYKDRLWKALDFVLPPRCVMTGEIVDRQGMIDPKIWRDLHFISDPVCACCGFPFEFEVAEGDETGLLCGNCLVKRPVYASARAALVYDNISRGMILKFKHADQTHVVHAFVPWLRRVGADMLGKADYLVPVPLHRFRLIQRRYNQAALIAQALGRECGIPYLPDLLKRYKSTKSQGYLGYKERQQNVKNVFTIAPRHETVFAGKTIILIDDVYTTGATVKECAKALLKAGSKEVHVLAVARVVRAEFNG